MNQQKFLFVFCEETFYVYRVCHPTLDTVSKCFELSPGPPCWLQRLIEFPFYRNKLPSRPSSSQAAKILQIYFAILNLVFFSLSTTLGINAKQNIDSELRVYEQSNSPLLVGSETNTFFPLRNAINLYCIFLFILQTIKNYISSRLF